MTNAIATSTQSISNQTFSSAISSWKQILGDAGVKSNPEELSRHGADCGLKEVMPKAVLIPENFEHLQKILKIANQNRISVYPSSKGKNWGYGSAAPISESDVVIDLKLLNGILELNKELAYVVVEPGVTQQQLFDYLEQHAPTLCMDVTGASPESSLIGNLVERGYGQTPNGDRFQNSSGMEVLLANGEVLRTGFWHYKESQSQHLYKWGIGPYLDGLFTQSNFGIVTKIGIWLMPKPKHIGLLLIEMKSDSHAAQITTKLRDLKLRGLLPATVHISNDIRLISCFDQFPYNLEDGQESLSDKARVELQKKWKFAPWTCFTSIRGSREEVKTTLNEIKKVLRSDARVQFITKNSVIRAKRYGRLFSWLTGKDLKQVEVLYKLVSGKPSNGPSLGTYWRHHNRPSSSNLDPLADRCGIIWCAPVIPATEIEIRKFLSLVDACMRKFGFESNLTLTMITDRSLCCTIAITFDKDNDLDRATNCYKSILENCIKNGFIPYRHGINVEDGKKHLFNSEDPFWKTCQALKNTFDEHHILSPGKYGIW